MPPIALVHPAAALDSDDDGSVTADHRKSSQFRQSVGAVHSMVLDHFTKMAAERKYLVDPRTHRMKQWDLVMIMLLLFTAVVTPAEVSFMTVSINALFVINRFVDLCFLWDMGIQCRLMFEAADGTFICSWRKSTWRYLKGWFVLDLISVIPFDVIGFFFEDSDADGKSSSVGNARILRNVRLLRLLKLLRIVRANRILTRWESRIGIAYSTISLYKFGITLVTLCHWGACMWYVAAFVEDDPSCDARIVTIPGTGEVLEGCPSWVTNTGVRGTPFGNRYSYSFYFAVTVLFSGGPAGDMMPQNMTERMCLTFLIAVSGSIYAYVIGAVCGIISQQDMATKIFRQSMDHLNLYMGENRLPQTMRVRMRNFFLRAREMHRERFYHETLQIMSPTLRGEVLAMTQGDWIQKVPFFCGAPPKEQRDFMSALVLCLKTELFAQQDMVVQEGELCNDMYIIQRGLVACLGRVLSRGRLVGQDMVLSRWKWRRQYSARALTFVEVQKITNEDLARTLDDGDFPFTRHNIKRSAMRLCLCRGVLLAASKIQAQQEIDEAAAGGGGGGGGRKRPSSFGMLSTFAHEPAGIPGVGGQRDNSTGKSVRNVLVLDGAADSNVLRPGGVGAVNVRRQSLVAPPAADAACDNARVQAQLDALQQQMAQQGKALQELTRMLRSRTAEVREL